MRATKTASPRAPFGIAHHRDAFVFCLLAVADGAVADQTTSDRIGQIGQVRLNIDSAGGQEHASRLDRVRLALILSPNSCK